MLYHSVRVVGCGKGLSLIHKLQAGSLWTPIQRSLVTSCCPVIKNRQRQANLWTHKNITRDFLSTSTHKSHISAVTSLGTFSPSWLSSIEGVPQKVPFKHELAFARKDFLAARLHTTAGLQQDGEEKVVKEDVVKPISKLKEWWSSQKEGAEMAPTSAILLGFSGLIPFMVPAVYSIVTMSCGPNIAVAQAAYGAVILSFLGGVRWGTAIAPPEAATWPSLCFSVMPSLVAWMGLLMPIQWGLFSIISGLFLAGVFDSRFKAYPGWFRSLRFTLTAFAMLSLGVTFVFSIIYPPPEAEHGYNFKKLIRIAQIIIED